MNISITVDGVEQTVAAFGIVERGLLDIRQLGTWDWVESEFRKVEKEIFESEGPGWKPLSSQYAAVKSRTWGNKPILQASGSMMKEFTTMGGGSVDKQAQEMSIAFGLPAGYHMGKGARSKMPYRSSLDLTEEQNERVLKPISKKFEQLADNAKLRDLTGR